MPSIHNFFLARPRFRRYVAEQLAQDADFIEDAKLLLALSEDQYLRLKADLNKSEEFLSSNLLRTMATESLAGDPAATKVASIIYRLGDILHSAGMPAPLVMKTLASAIEEKASGLTVEKRRTLVERIRSLVAEPVGLAKQYKAQQLVGAIGAELDDFRMICDIRPIFDKQRERIEGAFAITLFRLEYRRADGEPEVLEVRVSEKQIDALQDKLADAKRKLKLIGEMLATQHMPTPSVENEGSNEG